MSAMHEVADEYHLPLRLTMLADLKAKEGDPARGQQLYEQAADVVDTLLANSPSGQSKCALISTVSETCKGNFSMASKLDETEEAFRIVEAARGRSIPDLLSRPRPNQDEPSDRLRVAPVNLNGLQRALLDTSDRSNLRALQDQLFVAEQLAGSQRQPADAARGAAIQTRTIDLAKMRTVLLPDELLLEYVRQEVVAAEQSLNHPDRSVALLGPDATESKFKSQPLGNFKIFHFAVHGLSDPQFPDRAALVLGRDPNSGDYGLLKFQERAAQTCLFCRSAALPVFPPEKPQTSESTRRYALSACAAANGKLEGEEGIDGLAEAFLLAGAKSVVGALWEVENSATRSLMKAFYAHLAQGQDKASAPRQAKLHYLRTSANSSPALWAPFALVGDGSAPIIF